VSDLTILLTDQQLEDLANRIAAKLPAPATKVFYTEQEVAEMLGVSLQTLRNWRSAGKLESATNGKPVLYRQEHIDAAAKFIESRA